MDEKIIKELNAVHKGEQMAIEAYERFIQAADDKSLKREFQEIQKDHKRHASEIAERVRVLGGKPEYGTGFTGYMARAMSTVKNMNLKGDSEILKKAYDGEDKGIAKVEEIIKGDLDIESRNLIERMMSEDHRHLHRMAHMIAKAEEKH